MKFQKIKSTKQKKRDSVKLNLILIFSIGRSLTNKFPPVNIMLFDEPLEEILDDFGSNWKQKFKWYLDNITDT